MADLIVTFANNSILELKHNDVITPIVRVADGSTGFASMAPNVRLLPSVHEGYMDSLMHALVVCDFFYVNEKHAVVYSKNAIVKVEATSN